MHIVLYKLIFAEVKEGGSTVKQKEMDKFLFELSYLNTTALFALKAHVAAAAVFRKAGRCLGKLH